MVEHRTHTEGEPFYSARQKLSVENFIKYCGVVARSSRPKRVLFEPSEFRSAA